MLKFSIKEEIGVDRTCWGVCGGIPLPRGWVTSGDDIAIADANHEAVEADVTVMSRWEDGSVKFVRVAFVASVPAFTEAVFYAGPFDRNVRQPETGEARPAPRAIQIQQAGAAVIVNTARMEFAVNAERYKVFDYIKRNGNVLIDNTKAKGFTIIDENDVRFDSALCKNVTIATEEHGSVRAVLRVEGTHTAEDGAELFDFAARYYVYADSDIVEVEYTFINKEKRDWSHIRSIGCELEAAGHRATGLCGNYQGIRTYDTMFSLVANNDVNIAGTRQNCDFRLGGKGDPRNTGDSFSPAIWTHGWIGFHHGTGGVSASIYRLYPNYPKELQYDGANTIRMYLWKDDENNVLPFARGWAKTHKLQFYVYDGAPETSESNKIMEALDQPLIIYAPEAYVSSGIFEDNIRYSPDNYPQLEMMLRDSFHMWKGRKNRLFGMLDYGDFVDLNWNDHKGREYRGNMYFDYAHSLLLQYIRTGEREYYFAAESAVMHHLDIDFVHDSKFESEIGGIRCEGPNHGANEFDRPTIDPYYGGTESLIEFFGLTGDTRILGLAKAVCKANFINFMDSMTRGEVNRRQGWALVTLSALYEIAGDEEAYACCRTLAKYVTEYIDRHGNLKLTIGFGKVFSPLHAVTVAIGMYKYYRICRDDAEKQEVKRTTVSIVDSIIELGMFPDGGFIYVDYPELRWNWQMGEAIEPFGYAYALTGDEKYIALINRHLYRYVDVVFTALSGGGPRVRNGYIQSVSGVSIGINWRGLLKFMYWADNSGCAKDVLNL